MANNFNKWRNKMKKLILLALISTSAFAGLNRETCTTDKKDPVTNKETGVTETVTTTVCQSKYFTDADIKKAVKQLEEKRVVPDKDLKNTVPAAKENIKKVDNSKEKK
jgi:hypothetical protein